MSRVEEQVLDSLKAGRFFISVHAALRMRQRSVTKADIRSCGFTAKSCTYWAKNKTWRIEGEDLDGESLTIICGIDTDVVIVTIF